MSLPKNVKKCQSCKTRLKICILLHIFLATLFCASTYFHLCSSIKVIFDETSKRENVVIDCRDSTSCLVKCSQPDTCRGFTVDAVEVHVQSRLATSGVSSIPSLIADLLQTVRFYAQPQICNNLKVQNCRGQCTVEATNVNALNGANIDCRDSSRCSVECTNRLLQLMNLQCDGSNTCSLLATNNRAASGANIDCRNSSTCSVECTNPDSCKTMNLQCDGSSTCSLLAKNERAGDNAIISCEHSNECNVQSDGRFGSQLCKNKMSKQ